MSERRPSAVPDEATERTFVVEDSAACLVLYGEADRNLRKLRDAFPVQVHGRGGRLTLKGPTVDVAAAGGWRSLEALQRCYQMADEETMLAVVMGGGELREMKG